MCIFERILIILYLNPNSIISCIFKTLSIEEVRKSNLLTIQLIDCIISTYREYQGGILHSTAYSRTEFHSISLLS
jgi:hypothetical protein